MLHRVPEECQGIYTVAYLLRVPYLAYDLEYCTRYFPGVRVYTCNVSRRIMHAPIPPASTNHLWSVIRKNRTGGPGLRARHKTNTRTTARGPAGKRPRTPRDTNNSETEAGPARDHKQGAKEANSSDTEATRGAQQATQGHKSRSQQDHTPEEENQKNQEEKQLKEQEEQGRQQAD